MPNVNVQISTFPGHSNRRKNELITVTTAITKARVRNLARVLIYTWALEFWNFVQLRFFPDPTRRSRWPAAKGRHNAAYHCQRQRTLQAHWLAHQIPVGQVGCQNVGRSHGLAPGLQQRPRRGRQDADQEDEPGWTEDSEVKQGWAQSRQRRSRSNFKENWRRLRSTRLNEVASIEKSMLLISRSK